MFLVRFVGRVIRRIVALVLFGLIRARRVIAVAAALLVVAWIALANVDRLPIPAGTLPDWVPAGHAAAPAGPTPRAGQTAARGAPSGATGSGARAVNFQNVPAVDDYIKGLTTFDAKLMWGALSDDAATQMRQRGSSPEALQAGLDDAKRRGARYDEVTMIGDYPLSDGRRYLFYVMTRRGFTGPDQPDQVYFVFTVGTDGKITSIA